METKTCPKCKETKRVELFSRNKHKEDGLQRTCKQCIREAGIKSYNKNKKSYLSRVSKHNKSILDNVNQYKANQTCQKCGNDKYYLLDFHHIDPSIKDGDVNTIARTRGKQALQDEIAKCVVLCKNCHSDFHHLERNYQTCIFDYLPNLPRPS
jgi:hypothetical protein